MQIEKYEFGRVVINGKEYKNDVIVYPAKVETGWWRAEGHRLHIDDLREVLEYNPEVFIVGTGAYGEMKVPKELVEQLRERGMTVYIHKTEEACKQFNELINEGKRVVAALHLTC
jgi:hypothetical protein